jgi:hypothetical protein
MPEILMVNLKPADGGEEVSKEFMRIFLDFSHMNSARSSLDFWLKATPSSKQCYANRSLVSDKGGRKICLM